MLVCRLEQRAAACAASVVVRRFAAAASSGAVGVRRVSAGAAAGPPPPPPPPAPGDASSVLRPRVVSDYQSARVSSERAKWRLFGIATWVLTAAAGAWVALSGFPGMPGSGEHALSPLQRAVAGAADAVAGAAAPPQRAAPPPPPALS